MGDATASERAATDAAWTDTRFVVLGAGGLGCPALLGLTSAGARRLTVVDDDVVDATNLQRQVLYTTADVGMAKVMAAALHLRARVPGLELASVKARFGPDALEATVTSLERAGERVVVLDCSDDPQLKFTVNDLCLARGVPAVIAGVQRWRGHIMAIGSRTGIEAACFRCLFEAPPPRELAPACSAVGIMGSAAGMFGFWMANLAVRLAEGARDVAGALVSVDLLSLAIQTLAPRPRPGCPACARRPGAPRDHDAPAPTPRVPTQPVHSPQEHIR